MTVTGFFDGQSSANEIPVEASTAADPPRTMSSRLFMVNPPDPYRASSAPISMDINPSHGHSKFMVATVPPFGTGTGLQLSPRPGASVLPPGGRRSVPQDGRPPEAPGSPLCRS